MAEPVPLDKPVGDIDRMPGMDGMPDDASSPSGETRDTLPRPGGDPGQQEPPAIPAQ